jgi:hypothetical protein
MDVGIGDGSAIATMSTSFPINEQGPAWLVVYYSLKNGGISRFLDFSLTYVRGFSSAEPGFSRATLPVRLFIFPLPLFPSQGESWGVQGKEAEPQSLSTRPRQQAVIGESSGGRRRRGLGEPVLWLSNPSGASWSGTSWGPSATSWRQGTTARTPRRERPVAQASAATTEGFFDLEDRKRKGIEKG